MISRFFTTRTAPFLLAALVLVLFGDLLFFPHGRVISHNGEDLETQFLFWYDFGFRELRHGNLALWNPHVFSGSAWLGNFESALLYPPNWIFMLLPVGMACNWIVAFHVWLCSFLTFTWVSRRGVTPIFAFTAALMIAFGAPYITRLVPGHLTNLAAMAWTPLLFLAVDGILKKLAAGQQEGVVRYGLAGAFAALMQIFSGHPQTFFRSGVVVVLYLILRLLFEKTSRRSQWRAPVAVAGMYVLAVCMGALQLLPGLNVAGESTRSAGVPFPFVASMSFPPENILTLLAPTFFGNETDLRYWGRWLPWETTLYFSVAGLVAFAVGLLFLIRRRAWPVVCLLPLVFVLALGSNTPIYKVLYDHVPGFNKFRISAEFLYPIALFAAATAAQGLQALRGYAPKHPRQIGGLALGVLAAAFIVGGTGWWLTGSLNQGLEAPLARLMSLLIQQGQSSMPNPEQYFLNPTFLSSATESATVNLYLAAAVLLLASFVIWRLPSSPRAIYVLALLIFCELWGFALTHRPSFDERQSQPQSVLEFIAAHPKVRSGDERVLNLLGLNSGMSNGSHDIWGYDPVMPGRYTRWMAWTQGEHPDFVVTNVDMHKLHPLFAMLRCKYIFAPDPEKRGEARIAELPTAMPRGTLISNYHVLNSRDEMFTVMAQPSFNPSREVLLEEDPGFTTNSEPLTQPVRVMPRGTDGLDIETETNKPCILLITDPYSAGWRAFGLPDSSQQQYKIIPANYILRAIPLQPGKHHIRMEFQPSGVLPGKWISLAALILFVGLCIKFWPRKERLTPVPITKENNSGENEQVV